MKKLHFFNFWYGKLPWYYKLLIQLPIVSVYALMLFKEFFREYIPQDLIVIYTISILILWVSSIIYGIWQARVKNAFFFISTDSFRLRIDGQKIDFDKIHISEVGLDDNHLLQIRRINRVDSFDLSPFRGKDRDKLMKYLKEFLSDEIELHSNRIPTVWYYFKTFLLKLKIALIIFSAIFLWYGNPHGTAGWNLKGELCQQTSPDYDVAIQLINDYVNFLNNSKSEVEVINWFATRNDLSNRFKEQVIEILTGPMIKTRYLV